MHKRPIQSVVIIKAIINEIDRICVSRRRAHFFRLSMCRARILRAIGLERISVGVLEAVLGAAISSKYRLKFIGR